MQNRQDQPAFDASVLTLKILSCIYRVQEKYGAYVIAAVLCGKKNQDIERFGLKTISTFGIVTELSQRQIVTVIRDLIDTGYIFRSALHKNLILTTKGKLFLKEKPVYFIPQTVIHIAPKPFFALKLTSTHMATLMFWQREKSVSVVAKIRHITEQTVEDHLADLIYHGKITDIDDFLDKVRQDIIKGVVASYPTARLKVLKEHLPDEVSYAQIKFVLAAQRHQANRESDRPIFWFCLLCVVFLLITRALGRSAGV